MNDAHLHLIVNHFPIIGTVFGLGILIAGLVLKNNSVKSTAYIIFIVTAVFAAISVVTGRGAEELVKDMPNIGHQIIHEHEELAEKFALLLYGIGVFSLLLLYTAVNKHKFAKILSFITLILAIGAAILSIGVGTSGGEIRHTEIREDGTSPKTKTDEGIKNDSSITGGNFIKKED